MTKWPIIIIISIIMISIIISIIKRISINIILSIISIQRDSNDY